MKRDLINREKVEQEPGSSSTLTVNQSLSSRRMFSMIMKTWLYKFFFFNSAGCCQYASFDLKYELGERKAIEKH